MPGTAAGKPTALRDTQKSTQSARSFMSRKIWLPKLLYALLPYFYFASGLVAFLATIYISDWFWVLPHYLLFSAACIHFGVIVYRRRNRNEA
jgi:fatty acid desaturase